jgi:16S rRNA (cytosine1402-N4)-methyltransferase
LVRLENQLGSLNMSEEQTENLHRSVLLTETVRLLDPRGGRLFVDATLGLGGHAEALLASGPDMRVIGLDQDLEAIALATERLARFGDRIRIIHANFADLKRVLREAGIEAVDGVLADLGVSSLQFDTAERGFSFRFDAPLDMRMDRESDAPTAAELLADLSEEEIARIIYEYGEERLSRRIARRIVWKRSIGEPIKTTGELAETVEKAIGRRPKDKIHPATRTFQALRIAVNGELDVLGEFIGDAVDVLKKEGRLAIITFHSLEDRLVKQAFRKLSGHCECPPRMPQCVCGAEKKIEILTRRPIAASEAETAENPRARSAKLRVCMKL